MSGDEKESGAIESVYERFKELLQGTDLPVEEKLALSEKILKVVYREEEVQWIRR